MNSQIQVNPGSSRTFYINEQVDNNENTTGQIQVHEVSTTIYSNAEAILLS